MSSFDREAGSIFVHVPKCAGTSMSVFPWCRGSGHETLQDFFDKDQEGFEGCCKWAFVRNPWDRIASIWANIFNRFQTFEKPRDVKGWNALIESSTLKDSFFRFVDLLFEQRDKLQGMKSLNWANLPRLNLPHNRMHFFPCVSLLRVNGEMRADFVGKFENLEADWEKISKRFGNGEKLPTKNSHRSKFGKSYDSANLHNSETIEKVAEIYREDVRAFQYSFKR